MRKATLSILVLSSVLGGCAAQDTAPPVTPAAAATHAVEPASAKSDEALATKALERRVGDYVVHMISGSFRKAPARFTERVIDRENDAWIMELKLEDDKSSKILHVWVDANGEVQKVVRVTDKGQVPGKLADYEALLAAISVTPDENEGLTASTRGTCTVGPTELDCETKSYRVRLGDKEAHLGITQSAAFPGSDVSGEITLADGTVIFRSELLERGNQASADDSVAVLDESAKAPSAK
jgi:hypothetical protein